MSYRQVILKKVLGRRLLYEFEKDSKEVRFVGMHPEEKKPNSFMNAYFNELQNVALITSLTKYENAFVSAYLRGVDDEKFDEIMRRFPAAMKSISRKDKEVSSLVASQYNKKVKRLSDVAN